MVLDADVVVEPLTDDTLSESIRERTLGTRRRAGNFPAGHARLPAKRSAQGPLIGRMCELYPHVTARDGG